MKTLLVLVVAVSISINVYLYRKQDKLTSYLERIGYVIPLSVSSSGADCSIQMLNSDGDWESVILVHGYWNNLPAAQAIQKVAEESGERPKGCFRVVTQKKAFLNSN